MIFRKYKMKTLALSFYLYLFFFITHTTSTSNNNCTPSACGFTPRTPVRFPFRLTYRQPDGCGYPGFNLFCNNYSQTVLNLPTGEVIVKQIHYYSQTLSVDPQFCDPKKIHNFSLVGTPFSSLIYSLRDYTFLNCSFNGTRPAYRRATLYCLSGSNYIVSVLPTEYISQLPVTCRIISKLSIPARWDGYAESVTKLELKWNMPKCRSCEINGGTCGTKSKHPYEIVCFGGHYPKSSESHSTRAKYGLILGLGVPGFLFMIVVLCSAAEMARNQRLEQAPNVSSIPLTPLPANVTGLNRSTLESYPKRVLEVLPDVNEGTCTICLSDYKSKEEIRTIPDCSHYFHVHCIDEWLSLNATCPVCRNSQTQVSS